MKYLLIVLMAITFMGCATVEKKDISLKVRSPVVDIDYDSRVVTSDCDDKIFLPELKPLDYDGFKPLEPLK